MSRLLQKYRRDGLIVGNGRRDVQPFQLEDEGALVRGEKGGDRGSTPVASRSVSPSTRCASPNRKRHTPLMFLEWQGEGGREREEEYRTHIGNVLGLV